MVRDLYPEVVPCRRRPGKGRIRPPCLRLTNYLFFTLLLRTFASLPCAFAQKNASPDPAALPFSYFSNGQGRSGSWYGIPLALGPKNSQQYLNLTISTTSSFSWVISSDIEKKFCESLPQLPQSVLNENGVYGNRTLCMQSLGGSYDSSKDGNFKQGGNNDILIIDQANGPVYNFQGSSAFQNSDGTLLDIDGKGFLGYTTFSIPKLDLTGQVIVDNAFVLDNQLLGVTASYVNEGRGPRDVFATGQISLQQLTLSLFSNGFIASPTVYFQQDVASQDLTGSASSTGSPYYTLVFGGWDNYRISLNKTIQIPLIQVQNGTSPLPQNPEPGDFPAYRMELTISQLTWGYTGATERSLLNEVGPSEIKCLIDSTTPYIWLPPEQMSQIMQLAAVKVDKENSTLDDPNDNVPDSAASGHLIFGFEEMKGEQIRFENDPSLKIAYLTETENQPDFFEPHMFLPFRALSTTGNNANSPAPEYGCVLGKAFLQEVALFINYHDGWFGLGPGGYRLDILLKNQNKNSNGPLELMRWDVQNPPLITNSTVILDPSVKALKNHNATGNSGESSNVSGGSPRPGPPPRLIAAIVAGALLALVVAIVGILIFCCLRRRNATVGSQNKPDSDQIPIVQHPGLTGQGGVGGPVELHNMSSAVGYDHKILPQPPGRVELPQSHVQGPPPAYQYPPNGPHGHYPSSPAHGVSPVSPLGPQQGENWKPEGNQVVHEMQGNNGWNIQGQVYYEMGDRRVQKEDGK